MTKIALLIASLLSLNAAQKECLKNCQTSEDGRQFITQLEGYVPFIYKDVAGLPTIGVGHLIRPGEKFTEPLLPDEADALLKKDLRFAENTINRSVRIPLQQNRADACISLTFNIGAGGFQGSTVLKRVNAKRHAEVPAAMMMWNKARVNGVLMPVKGLTTRREREGELYLGDL